MPKEPANDNVRQNFDEVAWQRERAHEEAIEKRLAEREAAMRCQPDPYYVSRPPQQPQPQPSGKEQGSQAKAPAPILDMTSELAHTKAEIGKILLGLLEERPGKEKQSAQVQSTVKRDSRGLAPAAEIDKSRKQYETRGSERTIKRPRLSQKRASNDNDLSR